MTPFNTKEVTCYLLWIAIGVMVVGIAALLIYHAQGRNRIPANKAGATIQLPWPGSPSHKRA
ncbi:MAG: hypothetical protein WA414_17190 [Acidobacteriaceae bacterium]